MSKDTPPRSPRNSGAGKLALLTRRMQTVSHGGVTLLNAVERFEDGKRKVDLYFRQGADAALIEGGAGTTVTEVRSVGGAPWFLCDVDTAVGPIRFKIAGQELEVIPVAAEQKLFEGRNAALATRNGERPEIVRDWLEYHAREHAMDGAVILNRADPAARDGFAKKLARMVADLDHDIMVVVIDADAPLGADDAPPEAHPICVPEAPGKDRMEIPEAEPWSAPLAAVLSYEICRARFLGTARAVVNIDVYDLLFPGPQGSVFDGAVDAPTGLIPVLGQHCYPWRVRKDDKAHFADHICVQFDAQGLKQRWCIAPAKAPSEAVWRLVRIGRVPTATDRAGLFYRHMALRHPTDSVSKIVPKTSMIEHPPLLEMSAQRFGHNPVRMPELSTDDPSKGRGRAAIVTTMKNEGPFILEWIAYHRAIGFDDFLVYTNDCTDGTDTLLDLLQTKGYVQHKDNPFKKSGLKPQHAALQDADNEDVIKNARWVTCIDVDEYVNIKVGDGTLDALFAAVPEANMIAMTWRLFGNGDVHEFDDRPITEQFTRCAPELARKPHQAWGFKTLFKTIGLFKKLGVHRPKGLNPQLWEDINWVNGSGVPLPKEMFRNGWRSTVDTYGYDLVQLNHYAVRSAESFLVKRDRGRVNHVDRDQGLAYWFRMNNNYEEETSIQSRLPMMRAEMDKMLADPQIRAAHNHAVEMHRAKIDALKATEKYSAFYAELTGPRLEKLSRMHLHFGSAVFLTGPDCVPAEVIARDPDEEFFFTVEAGETNH